MKLYDFEARKDLPQTVPVLADLIGKAVASGGSSAEKRFCSVTKKPNDFSGGTNQRCKTKLWNFKQLGWV